MRNFFCFLCSPMSFYLSRPSDAEVEAIHYYVKKKGKKRKKKKQEKSLVTFT